MFNATRNRLPCLAGAALCALAGCNTPPETTFGDQGPANAALVQRVFDQAAQNAAVAEGAVYPHHFVPNDAALNELGEEHVAILAAAWMNAPGRLVMPRGDAPAKLHEARVQAVLRTLTDAGVDTQRLANGSDLPGGPGMGSWRAVRALEGDVQRGQAAPAGGRSTQSESR